MYKISKFTYNCINSNGELLLYNTYMGTRSFCKFSNNTYKHYFENKSKLDLDENILEKLSKKGIIVKDSLDENKKLYNQYIDNISPKN